MVFGDPENVLGKLVSLNIVAGARERETDFPALREIG